MHVSSGCSLACLLCIRTADRQQAVSEQDFFLHNHIGIVHILWRRWKMPPSHTIRTAGDSGMEAKKQLACSSEGFGPGPPPHHISFVSPPPPPPFLQHTHIHNSLRPPLAIQEKVGLRDADGFRTSLMDLEEVLGSLRGPAGSRVMVTLGSSQSPESLHSLFLERRPLPQPPIKQVHSCQYAWASHIQRKQNLGGAWCAEWNAGPQSLHRNSAPHEGPSVRGFAMIMMIAYCKFCYVVSKGHTAPRVRTNANGSLAPCPRCPAALSSVQYTFQHTGMCRL